VAIPGWFDEDGEQVTSAVFVQCDAPAKQSGAESKHAKHIKMLEAAWWHSGAEDRDGKPYISRSGFKSYLVGVLDMTEGSAKVYTKPSATGKPICDLLVGRVIDSHEHGWMVMDQVICSAWMMAKNG
jgi:hypothetical protein